VGNSTSKNAKNAKNGESGKRNSGAWSYVPKADYWDEAVTAAGFPRQHWRRLASAFSRMGSREFSRHWRSGQQLIQANGITFNAYDDPQGREREWPMDPIPMVIDDVNWAFIEKAVIQRATLLNMILGDLYGPQKLIESRRLPPELVFANPHFLRPCAGFTPPGGSYLHAYAVDLARARNGSWWVLADRTQAPSGMGYALENRLVSARTFPQVFMQCQVRQLTRYFQTLRNGLLELSPGNKSMPRAVILTPGPHNETYFEHAFLARHYNFTLVESADLTVRDDRVFLKTLAGLEPVDLILRRQDDAFCDPLELRSDSVLGVPGLVQAARKGHVAIANALGSGLMQTPVHMAFLPGLCRHLLNEQLHMPSVATWWCGDEEPRRYVLDNIGDLVIKPAFPRHDRRAVFGADLDSVGLAKLRAEIEAQPGEFVAQEKVALSMAPCWRNESRTSEGHAIEGPEPRHVVLRVFAAWDGQSYTVMPGGLTRVATAQKSMVVSLQMGGGSKDTWVTGGTEDQAPAGPIVRPVRTHTVSFRAGSDLSSRTADNLFWLGRYTERVESTIRMVRTLLPALSGEEDFGQLISLDTAIQMLVALRYLPREVRHISIHEQRRQTERLLTDLIHDPMRHSGVGSNLRHLRRVAWQLKERLSFDTWRVLQQLETDLTRSPAPLTGQPFIGEMDLLDDAIVTLSAFAGLAMENKTRGLGWRFLDIGRRIERCLQMSQTMRCGLGVTPTLDVRPFLETMLQFADSSITYRRRYMSDLSVDCVLDLLLVDEQNPRSVGYQLATLDEHVRKLPEHHNPHRRYPAEQRIAWKLLMSVRLAKLEEISTPGGSGSRKALSELLDTIQRDCLDLSDALSAQYLTHLAPSRLISSL